MKYLIVIICLINFSFAQIQRDAQIKDVFSYDMINSEIDYFEQFVGIAKQKYGNSREYVVEGCVISVALYEDSNQIKSLYTELTKNCAPDFSYLSTNFNISKPLQNMTFGDLDNPKYYADCLISCGRTSPQIYAVTGGSRADDWQTIALGAKINDVSYPNWSDKLMENGRDWVLDQKFNCDGNNYSRVAHSDLKNQNVSSITLAKTPITFDCYDRQPQQANQSREDIAFYQANDIYNIYSENEALGNKMFKGKEVLISGIVYKVRNHTYTDEVIIALKVEDAFGSVDLYMQKGKDDYAYSLRKGQEIRMKCIGDGQTMDPKFIKCHPV